MMEQQTIHKVSDYFLFNGFFLKVKSRNSLLYYFGWLNLLGFLLCLLLIQLNPDNIILGINGWIKPAKFFISIALLSWTMSWYLVYWQNRKAVTVYSWVLIISMTIELLIINWQAANGRLSHFNISTTFYALLFEVMGIAITIFTLWTLYIAILFFRQKTFPIWMSEGYKWGIRWGLIFFVIFAFEGGVMAGLLHHTIGAADGGEGLPFVNWSIGYGDLRVAHFFGMHSLQLLPLFGYWLARTRSQIRLFSIIYFLFVCLLLWQAFEGFPLLP